MTKRLRLFSDLELLDAPHGMITSPDRTQAVLEIVQAFDPGSFRRSLPHIESAPHPTADGDVGRKRGHLQRKLAPKTVKFH